jgi:hypothetical protein
LRIAREIGTEWLQAFALRYHSRVALAMGQTIEAGLHLDQALVLLAQTRPRPLLLEIVLGYAEIAAAAGRINEAFSMAAMVAESPGCTFDTGQHARHLAASLRDLAIQPAAMQFDAVIEVLLARLGSLDSTASFSRAN